MERVDSIGCVARWKPVHLGHAAMLDALLERAERVTLGIGSSNVHDARNPFTADETADMIRLALGDESRAARVTIVPVPDLGDGPRWRRMVADMFGPLDLFVTANAYVKSLLDGDYPIVHPARLVPEARKVAVDGAMVRLAMARGEDWEALVPQSTARYLKERGLVERFRREFGLETIARVIA